MHFPYFLCNVLRITSYNCSTKTHTNGTITHFHIALTPVLANPKSDKVIALAPEFVQPQHKMCTFKDQKNSLVAKNSIRKNTVILIVDDVDTSTKVLTQLLRTIGFRSIYTATNGEEALHTFNLIHPHLIFLDIEYFPDLILLDIIMPGMDGYEVCKQLKGNELTRDIMIIFISAMGSINDEKYGLEIGAVDYIAKPFNPAIVSARVRNHIELSYSRRKLANQNKAKSDFLSNISHEIRTPLTTIIGFAETLLAEGHLMADGQRIKVLNTIRHSGRHLLKLMNDLLDLSKIEAGLLTVEQLSVPLFEILDEVYNLYKPLSCAKGLDFSIHYMLPLPQVITTDPTRLRQILFNLCSNAIKFTERGNIWFLVSCDRESNQLVLTVTDTGIGIDDHQSKTLFKPFIQGDSFITRCYGGTGLGLNIARHLAEHLGGTVTMDSISGIGSIFIIVVDTGPLDNTEWVNDLEQIEVRSNSNLSRMHEALNYQIRSTVLLADDNKDNQHLISFYLQRAGAVVTIAENGQEAVEKALDGDFDLILMDKQMPIMDGLQATKLLRQVGFSRPIVALSASTNEKDHAEFIQIGCNEFLSKPINWEKFHHILVTYLPTESTTVTPFSLMQQTPGISRASLKFPKRTSLSLSGITRRCIPW